MKHVSWWALALSSLALACSSTDDGNNEPEAPAPTDSVPNDVPPDPDPCGLESSFEGDELCIVPPDPAEGIQLHTGPSSYDDPEALAPFLIEGGEENVRCYLARVSNGGFYYFRQQNRMRSGSHHMLIGLVEDTGQAEGPSTQCDLLSGSGSIPGSQTPANDFPSGELAPEDTGLARYLPANTMASFQLHYVNTGDEPMLREAWVNLYREEESAVTQKLQTVFLVADIGVDIPAGTRQMVATEYTPELTEPIRVYQLTGHSHAHAESFTVWRVRNEQWELIYQSFDWAEPDVLIYNSVVQNSAPDAAALRDGGATGLLYLEPGDRLEWACNVNNTLDTPLNFANEAYTAEMCLLGGSYISDTSGLMAAACANGTCFAGLGR